MNHLLQYFGRFLLNLSHYESVDCSTGMEWNGMVECNFVCFVLLLLFAVVVVFWTFFLFNLERNCLCAGR